MKPRHFLRELERVAAALELSVRTQPFRSSHSAGGLCKLRGKQVVLLNSHSHEDERALVLAEVLARMDISDVSMSEEVRQLLGSRRPANAEAAAPKERERGPGLKRAAPRSKR